MEQDSICHNKECFVEKQGLGWRSRQNQPTEGFPFKLWDLKCIKQQKQFIPSECIELEREFAGDRLIWSGSQVNVRVKRKNCLHLFRLGNTVIVFQIVSVSGTYYNYS